MNKKIATYLCCLILTVFAMNLTIISPLLSEISQSFSLSLSEAGILFTAEFAGFIAFILVGGFLADKFGKKLIISISLFGMVISIFLFTLTGSFAAAMALMVLIGGFGGVIESMATAMVSDLNDVNRSFYVNLSQVFFGIGAIIGPLAAGFIISSGADWRVCYYILGALLVILSFLFTAWKMPELPRAEAMSVRDVGKALKSRRFIAICLCMTFYTGSEVGGWGWLSTLLKENMGFAAAKAGLAVAAFWTAMTAGRLLCGQLTFRFSLKRIVIILAGLSSIVTFLSVFAGSEILMWCVIVLMGLTYSSQFPLIVDLGTAGSSVSSGITVALLMGSGGVGSMAVPYLMGLVGDLSDLRYSMLIPGVLLMMVAIIFSFLGKEKKVKAVSE